MTNEEKQLLMKDLSARLPYGVMVHWNGEHELVKLYMIKLYGYIDDYIINGLGQPEPGYEFDMRLNDILPYLRPMSSMTNEEIYELREIIGKDVEITDGSIDIIDSSRKGFSFLELQAVFDWLNTNHFDYRGLIGKDLALEAPKDMYNLKNK